MSYDSKLYFDLPEQKFAKKKQRATILAESLERLDLEKMAERVDNCGSYLQFSECPHGHERKLNKAYFCRVRLCPMCAWRKSLVTYHQTYEIAHRARELYPELEFIFVTLTIRNVEAKDLSDAITKLLKGLDRFMKLRGLKKHIKGWMRSLEVTRNRKRGSHNYGTYHPHFHLVWAVDKEYFKTGYKTKQQLADLWAQSVRIDYDPVVDVRKVKPKKRIQFDDFDDEELKRSDRDDTIAGMVAEVSKYSVKDKDILDEKNPGWTDSSVETLLGALKSRRLIAFGGIFKEIRQELKQADVDEADLIHVAGEKNNCGCSVCKSDFLDIAYQWVGDHYQGRLVQNL